MGSADEHGRSPFRQAVESRDFERLLDTLAPDVQFRSPAVYKPYAGREAVGGLLRIVAEVLAPELVYQWQIREGDREVLCFTSRVGDREVEGVDLLRYDPNGKVAELVVMIRPVSGLTAIRDAVAAGLQAGDAQASRASRATPRPWQSSRAASLLVSAGPREPVAALPAGPLGLGGLCVRGVVGGLDLWGLVPITGAGCLSLSRLSRLSLSLLCCWLCRVSRRLGGFRRPDWAVAVRRRRRLRWLVRAARSVRARPVFRFRLLWAGARFCAR
ncbi:MAG: nuclear transport factor 2 family protein [Solirubrobacteraceae bacterium]